MSGPVVLQVLDSLEVGGAQRVALQLSRWCVENGIACVLAAPSGPLLRELPTGVRFFERRERGFGAQTRELRKMRHRSRATVMHAHQRREALQALAAAGRSALVVEHAHTLLASRSKVLDPLSFRSRAIFAVSPAVASMVAEDFGRAASRVEMIGNPVDRDMFADHHLPRPRGRRAMHVVAIGRLVDQKDPLRFVGAIRELVRRGTAVEASWYGSGPLLGAARTAAARHRLPLRFLPPVPDVRSVLDRADVLAMTSKFEGTPLVALEAFARHTPVVATASSGGDGALGGGRAIVLPDASGPEQFADALIDVCNGTFDVDRMTSDAAEFARIHAHPDRVFAPVGRAYRVSLR
ncbi:glycosyltransferase [Curtobacterium pusillum]|uniref:glycosyltransferase n=1 Tax=Curtobacterium pusillum TaxID=69373 RepID=UPI00164281BD|nr:glycosyltransferase [Curtobacterium pusillum]